ncbi:hypothetical protein BDV28DRAFT_155375 [Aspergillus coremiiformis]|uniref:Fe2OG dioxygenase domain-containing protein n=1 Tax=Aspergillus coremiiformis TaxID=138285 RepID=A0A5N6ZE28_9EURO|nr:hypothetical protein BDV28DRAFT_155375 [Aspergillus coremiiformis]
MAPIAIDTPIRLPPKIVGPTTKTATRPTKQLPRWLIDGAKIEQQESFDPKKHIYYEPPRRIYTMKEINLDGHGISPNAVSEPFPLFTTEAVRQMRAEIFSPGVLAHCQYTSTFSQNMIRGMGAARAPFTYDAWNSAEVLAKVSEVAGVDLVPALDVEIATINISVHTDTGDRRPTEDQVEDEISSTAWHYDSFPFVCVTMISDCQGMIGGETMLRMPTGEMMKVRGPAMGTAVVMQGRYIEHQGLTALGGRERISMVTAFRPKSPFIKDESILTGVRGISMLSDLYHQYTQYRLEILEERIRARLKQERQRELANRPFDTPDVRNWLIAQKEFIDAMLEELSE